MISRDFGAVDPRLLVGATTIFLLGIILLQHYHLLLSVNALRCWFLLPVTAM